MKKNTFILATLVMLLCAGTGLKANAGRTTITNKGDDTIELTLYASKYHLGGFLAVANDIIIEPGQTKNIEMLPEYKRTAVLFRYKDPSGWGNYYFTRMTYGLVEIKNNGEFVANDWPYNAEETFSDKEKAFSEYLRP